MKKTIVISAVNLFEGGALSILRDCFKYLDMNLCDDYEIIAFVHKKSLLDVKNISLIELPKSRSSYFLRLFYEYIWFYFQSKKIRPYLWLSLHDITPNVKAQIRAVYCHNPSPFYNISFKEFLVEPSFGFFNKFYKLLYLINLNKNKYVIVQQNWLRDKFKLEFHSKSEIVVANPSVALSERIIIENAESERPVQFFFPSFPRVFKNFECACDAAIMLREKGLNFEILLTISGNENKYAKQLFKRYGKYPEIKFMGILSRCKVFETYQQCDALIFPSKLETWGLPITEAKAFSKPIFVADLPYAHETVGNYEKVSFFNPEISSQLAYIMESFIKKNLTFEGSTLLPISEPYGNSWDQIFKILLR